MKLKRTINNNEGIYEIECKNHDEALALLKLVKEEYPYAIIEATGYYSKIYILNIFANWGDYVTQEIAEDGELTTCVNCGRCDNVKKPSRHSSLGLGSSPERCFFEEFWSEVIQNKAVHFIQDGHAYSFTKGEGGFGGTRYTIHFENGEILKDMGMWHRGEVPDSIAPLLRKATAKSR